jgi:WD40 repeat protein
MFAMTTTRFALVSCVAVLFAAGAVLGLRAGHAADPPVSRPVPPPPEPPLAAGAVRIGTDQFRHSGWWSRVFLTDGGNTLLVVGQGVVVVWWNVETGKKLHEITLEGNYQDAAFAPEADLLAVAGTHQPDGENGKSEHVLWLIDAAARKLVRTVGLPSRIGGNHQKVQISADGKRVFVEYEGDIQVIDGKTGDELIRHKGRVNAGALAASRDGKLVAFGRYDVFLWQWETGEEPKKLTAVGRSGTERMQFSPDGKTLTIVLPGGMIATWDMATGRQTGSRPLRSLTNNLEFSPDGKTLAVASHPRASRPPEGGHAIDLLDAKAWKEVGRIPLGRVGVEHLSWSKDGSRLAGVSDYRAWAWDVKTGKVLGPNRPGHEGAIAAMAFGPDGTLFTASDDHTIRSWRPATGAPGLELVHAHWVRDLAVSPDGALVVGSALRNDLRVWDAKTGKQRYKLLGNGEMGGKRHVRFTPDGKHLVAWGDDAFVRVWEVRNGKLLSEHSTRPPGKESDPDDPFGDRMRFMEAALAAADISPDGTALALSTAKGLRILDPMTGKERQTLTLGDNRPNALAFSPDAKRIAVALQGKTVQTKLPDGRTRYSVEKAYPVTVWELASGKPLWTATAEGNWPGLAYSPDGSRVAVVSNVWQGPSRVWVWDAATGVEAGRIELPRPGRQLAFDRTGKRLAVSLDDTTALVYNLETALGPAK